MRDINTQLVYPFGETRPAPAGLNFSHERRG
jgi:hypothetical protein